MTRKESAAWLEKLGWKRTYSEDVYENKDGTMAAIISVNGIFFHDRTRK